MGGLLNIIKYRLIYVGGVVMYFSFGFVLDLIIILILGIAAVGIFILIKNFFKFFSKKIVFFRLNNRC
jgi:hypothetical protein